MAAPSSLSVTARTLRTHLAGAIGLPEGQILIGHPGQAAEEVKDDLDKQFLNLFFYRIDHGAVPSDGSSEDPFLVRIYCLITPLGTQESADSNPISAGENDLRLIGSVMQRLHQRPILSLQGDDTQPLAQLNIVLHALSLDEINHLWSMQADTPYRLSVGYEIALVPLPLVRRVERSPRVGSIGVGTQHGVRYRPLPATGLAAAANSPQVPAVFVDSDRPDWAPHLCWFADGSLQYSLVFPANDVPEQLLLIALGEPGVEVELEWELWRAAGGNSWQATASVPSSVALTTDTVSPLQPVEASAGLAKPVVLPLTEMGQAVLYAVRVYTRPDGVALRLRSNPLLVSLHGGPP